MDANYNRPKYPDLHSYLELFLKDTLTIWWRGEIAPRELVVQLSQEWNNALSGEIALENALQQIWRPLAVLAASLVDRLITQVHDVGIVASNSTTHIHGFLYVFRRPGSEDALSWLGGLPASPRDWTQFYQQFGFELPQSYREFGLVHNGLCRDGWSELGLRPINKLYLVDKEKGSFTSDFSGQSNVLLAFSGDGVGNEQCYDLEQPFGSLDYWTVDWDHETGKIGQSRSFWGYLDLLAREEMG